MTTPIALNPASRAAAIAAMSGAELEVLVVGGGIVGARSALDAVTHGLSTGLIEQRDLASGTSSRSSELVHGGLRYLAMFDFALVKEALEERGLLLTRLAPHWCDPCRSLPVEEGPRAAVRRRRTHAVRRHGDLRIRGCAQMHHRPGAARGCLRLRDPYQPAGRAEPYLAAEADYAVTLEGARHLDDVLTRRTRISIETFDRGTRVAQEAAELMAGELGWDDATLAEDVDHYLRRVEAERQSRLKLTDQEADEASVQAPHIG